MEIGSELIVIDFIKKMKSITCFDRGFELLDLKAKSLGFDGSLYTYQPRVKKNVKPVIMVSPEYGQRFLDNYITKNLAENDFVINHAIQQKVGFFNWVDYAENVSLTDNEASVLLSAQSYGLRNGISFVFEASKNKFACVSFVCKKDNRYFQEICLSNLAELQIVSELFHNAIMRRSLHQEHFINPILGNINETKKLILNSLCQGKNTKTIACELNISDKYVQNLVTLIRKDFQCKSRDELMYLLGTLELVK